MKADVGIAAPPKQELSKSQRFIAGGGHILNDLCGALWFTYFLLFMTKVVKIPESTAAGLLLFGQVIDGIATPIIGYATDKISGIWPCKKDYGRCKSWHLLGVILVTLTYPFIFSPAVGYSLYTDEWSKVDDTYKVIYYAVFIAVFQVGWASAQISHLALIPKLTSDEFVRTEVLAIRYACTVASNMSAYVIAWIFLTLLGQESSGEASSSECEVGNTNGATFNHIVLSSVVLGLVFSILFHFFVIEKPDDVLMKKSSSSISIIQLQPVQNGKLVKEEEALKKWRRSPGKSLLATPAKSTSPTKKLNPLDYETSSLLRRMLSLHCHPTLHKSLHGISSFIRSNQSGFGMRSRCLPSLDHVHFWFCRFHRRGLAYTIGGILILVASSLIMFYASENRWGIYVIAILLGGGSSAMLVTSLSVTADLIGDNVQSGAFVYGSMSLIDKISSGLMVMLISSVNPCKDGSEGCAESDAGKNFYRDALGFSSGGFAIVGMICTLIIKLLLMRKSKAKGGRLAYGVDGGDEGEK
ncbi:Major facilitator superfamily domain-containing protein 12 [Orchesella cincta]|uniref:Major facilitator superfamily domain-containing protein 12 n=1 Tax=Orchesella cincta TaxID=48709 RepID=A0A1D2MCV7_ORCCI|nr:Major facilitator superfamily domain-containing protein 12 [Orchesella cincta]